VGSWPGPQGGEETSPHAALGGRKSRSGIPPAFTLLAVSGICEIDWIWIISGALVGSLYLMFAKRVGMGARAPAAWAELPDAEWVCGAVKITGFLSALADRRVHLNPADLGVCKSFFGRINALMFRNIGSLVTIFGHVGILNGVGQLLATQQFSFALNGAAASLAALNESGSLQGGQ